MVITPHVLVGAAIGSKIDSYWLVAALSLAAHYAADFIPHREYGIDNLKKNPFSKEAITDFFKVGVDFLCGVFLVILFLNTENFFSLNYMATGMFFSILPDIFTLLKFIFNFKILNQHFDFHKFIHFFKDKSVPKWVEVGSQIIVSLIALWVIGYG